ncbi:MAG: beta-propeller domain-containing protein, partial [Acidimicrobiia bacterium]|nr:beta-propeller domain-containing protein [Acidimicrobiia bacterium]
MKRLLTLALALALVGAACTSQNDTDAPGGSSTSTGSAGTIVDTTNGSASGVPAGTSGGPVGLFASSLERFDSCDAFLSHVKAEALERVGPYGLAGSGYFGGPVFEGGFAVAEDAAGADRGFEGATVTTAAASFQEGVDYSGTNVQERGVDEPDIVKTDGERILVVAQGALHYFDATEEGPVERGSVFLEWGWNQEMLLSGDTVVVMTTLSRWDLPVPAQRGIFSPDYGGSEISALVEVDISDPDELRVGRRLYIDGRYVSARMVEDTARVVVSTQPIGLEFVYPANAGLRGEERATEVNRQAIEESTIDNWVPYYIMEDGNGEVLDEGNLIECENAHHPSEFSGFGMLSILTVNLDQGVDPASSIGVLAGGETVYASTDSLYVASQRWVQWDTLDDTEAQREADTITTNIHKFNISDPARTTYDASGSVDGFLLDQFSLSEHEGYLRVASTNVPSWSWWGNERRSESFVTVFEQDGGALVEAGSVGGLGLGEQIYAVRFLGDVGYVVTFRQVDPLYTIDLSTPDDPKAVGELKIPGFSSYLHPIEEGLLLGVGQDATEDGATRGTQVSLFDVSDLANPIRLQQWTMPTESNGSSYSEVEYDHRAFLHWPSTGMTVLPITRYSWDEAAQT